MTKVLAINPHYGEAYAIAGHFFIINRRYEEGIAEYRKALNSILISKRRGRVGRQYDAPGPGRRSPRATRASLQRRLSEPGNGELPALIDSYKNYDTFSTPTTILQSQKKESALLEPYFQEEFDRALATYEKKYQYKLTRPVQIEAYPNHDDFAVRTHRHAGLGRFGRHLRLRRRHGFPQRAPARAMVIGPAPCGMN